MNQITLLKRDGSTLDLFDKTIPRTVLSAKQSVDLLNKNVVNLSLKSALPVNIEIGDKINVFGRTYKLNLPAKEQKLNTHLFVYDLELEGVMYDLIRATYDINIDTTGADVQGESLTGDLRRFMNVLIQNANRVFPGKWVLGVCTDTDTKTLTFDDSSNCLSMLQMFCKEFNLEFDIAEDSSDINTINIGTVGTIIPFTFKYGMGNGLYDLTREKVSSSNIVNRMKVYGSNKNITSKYRATKLCLPGKTKAQSYIEDSNSIAQFGIWENTKTFDDVYPHRIGTVTAIGSTVYKFVDTAMFDLNEKELDGVTTKYLIAGLNAKVHFNTGNLAGYEFDIHSYDHLTKTFTIVKQTDQRSMSFPSESSSAFQIGIGDEYVLLDIALPQSYIDTAETDLLDNGVAYLAQNCQPKVQYSLSIEKMYLKTIATEGTNIFSVGDYVSIQDTDIAVDKSIRIKSLTRNLIDEYEYSITIADLAVQRSIYQQIVNDINDIDKIITINDLRDPAKARRNWLSAQEVLGMVFDPEGDYYTDKIKPGSIETLMLSVGAKSMQFLLQSTTIESNYLGDAAKVNVTGGVLSHYTIAAEIKNWNLASALTVLPSNATAYYIYAKCEKSGTAGSIIFSTEKLTVDSDTSYYHFWIGVLNSVIDNVRAINLMYGFTTINGKFIKTGKISSIAGGSYIDLDGNKAKIGNGTTYVSFNEDGTGTLKAQRLLIVSPGGQQEYATIDRGDYNASTLYYAGDQIKYVANGNVYKCILDCPTAGIMPTNTSYWRPVITKGENGAPSVLLFLSNANHVIPTDANGNNGVYTNATTTISLYVGGVLQTIGVTLGFVASDASIIYSNPSTFRLDVVSMGVDTGYITVSALYNGITYTSQFRLSKNKNGSNGQNATSYWLSVDVGVITKLITKTSTTYNPTSFNIYPRMQVGTATPTYPPGCLLYVYGYDAVGNSTTLKNAISIAGSSYSQAVGSYVSYKIQMYLGTTLLDEETIFVVENAQSAKDLIAGMMGPFADYAAFSNFVTQYGTILAEGGRIRLDLLESGLIVARGLVIEEAAIIAGNQFTENLTTIRTKNGMAFPAVVNSTETSLDITPVSLPEIGTFLSAQSLTGTNQLTAFSSESWLPTSQLGYGDKVKQSASYQTIPAGVSSIKWSSIPLIANFSVPSGGSGDLNRKVGLWIYLYARFYNGSTYLGQTFLGQVGGMSETRTVYVEASVPSGSTSVPSTANRVYLYAQFSCQVEFNAASAPTGTLNFTALPSSAYFVNATGVYKSQISPDGYALARDSVNYFHVKAGVSKMLLSFMGDIDSNSIAQKLLTMYIAANGLIGNSGGYMRIAGLSMGLYVTKVSTGVWRITHNIYTNWGLKQSNYSIHLTIANGGYNIPGFMYVSAMDTTNFNWIEVRAMSISGTLIDTEFYLTLMKI